LAVDSDVVQELAGYLAHHCPTSAAWVEELAVGTLKLIGANYEPLRASHLVRFIHDRAASLNKVKEARFRQAIFRCLLRLQLDPSKHDMSWDKGYGVNYKTYVLYDDKVCVRYHIDAGSKEVVTDFVGFFDDAKRRRR
jgi:hypothetical protein